MSIQPIDLQTLFMNMSHVGKDISAQRDALIQNQAVTAGEIAQKAAQNTTTVHKSDEVSDGPETVTEDGSNPQRRRQKSRRESAKAEADTDAVFQDPSLGKHIDLTG